MAKRNNIKIECFCDKKQTGIHKKTGLPIINIEQLKSNYPNANIIICSLIYYDEILQDLKKAGFSDQVIDMPYHIWSHLTKDEYKSLYDKYKWAYDFFKDDISKQIILGRIKSYLSKYSLFEKPLFPVSSIFDEYFEPGIISLTENEIFIDGGMYDGQTAITFFEKANNKWSGYWGFEIDNENFKKAETTLKECKNANIIKKGLWSCNTTLKFNSGNDSGCSINENGDESVEVTSLDYIFKNSKELPTFIKMDIEGAEKQALLGAETIIRKAKPKLAICVYHKKEDIYELPKLIYNINPEYRFCLKHYGSSSIGTVMYAW